MRCTLVLVPQAKGTPMQRAQIPPRPEIKMHRVSDVIEISRLSHSTIYNRIRDGSLQTVKVCGARLITDEALRRLLKLEGAPGDA
jgi:hypothetical protein